MAGSSHRSIGRLTSVKTCVVLVIGLLAVLISTATSISQEPLKSTGVRSLKSNAWERYAPGPWGRLERVRITLAFPEELVPSEFPDAAREVEWFFPTPANSDFSAIVSRLQLAKKVGQHLLQVATLEEGGAVVKPSDTFVLNLPAESRSKLYRYLATSSRNADHREPFAFNALELAARIEESHLSTETIKALSKLMYRNSDRVLFCDQNLLLRSIPDAGERREVVKLLYRFPTYMLRIRLDEDSDVEQLARYWDPLGNRTIEELLRSVHRIESNAAVIDVSLLLTSFARSRLYTYPRRSPLREWGPDCYWTAANFFRQEPDDAYFSPSLVAAFVNSKCDAIGDAPRFGDIAIFRRKDTSEPIHAAVYVAADMFFTKNGNDYRVPWTFSSLADIELQYGRHHGLSVYYARPRSGE